MSALKKSFQFGQHTISIETGEIARQASASVVVSMGDTVVLVTAVAAKKAVPGKDFFPLTVNYIEKTYAAGRIPGGFFKREGRPTEKETLTSRLIDRPIRPLFPDGFFNEVQVVATVVSMDPDIDADIPALIGASAALSLAGVPFAGPIGAARVGYKDGKYLLNPTQKDLKESQLHLVVAGTAKSVLMVESEAKGLSEEVMLGAVVFGHEQMQIAIKTINDMVAAVGKPKWEWKLPRPIERRTRRRRCCERQGRVVRGLPDHRKAVALLQGCRDQGRLHAGAGRRRGSQVHRRRRRQFALQAREQHRAPAHPQW